MIQDKYSCDYDTRQIQDDSRFLKCRRDMALVQVTYLGYTILLIVLSYWLCPDDVSEMTYLFGLPLWAAAALLLTAAFTLYIIIWALTGPNFSLDAKEENEPEK